jgi:ATP-dependent 26S proteasome regulatory subunit
MAAAAALGAATGDLLEDVELDQEILNAGADDLHTRARLLDAEVKVLKSEAQKLRHDISDTTEKIRENAEKIKLNKQLPYLVGNVVEILRKKMKKMERTLTSTLSEKERQLC